MTALEEFDQKSNALCAKMVTGSVSRSTTGHVSETFVAFDPVEDSGSIDARKGSSQRLRERHGGPVVDVFEAFVVLLPHGYPCSSYEFRDYMRQLGGDWRLLAPDFSGSGYSATPEAFAYDFDGFTSFLEEFADTLGVERFALYLHDFGSQIGLRLAIRNPGRIAALIIQNGDIYQDVLGAKYAGLKDIWKMERPKGIGKLRESISKDHFRDEFLNDVRPELAQRIPPDLWELHWPLMTQRRQEIAARLIYDLKDNLAWFSR